MVHIINGWFHYEELFVYNMIEDVYIYRAAEMKRRIEKRQEIDIQAKNMLPQHINERLERDNIFDFIMAMDT